MLHIDLPTLSDFSSLSRVRSDACVSIYLPTTPVTRNVGASRIAFGNQIGAALAQLEGAGFDKHRLADLDDQLEHLRADDEFWRVQANSLAVLATPDRIRTFRLANRLGGILEVSDRFHLKPLLRAITFPHAAFVLALSDNAVRLIEMSADMAPEEVEVPGLPKNLETSVGHGSLLNRESSNRGHKLRQGLYARRIDQALRRELATAHLPLILAAAQPLDAIYRGVNTYPGLLDDGISASPDRLSPAELAEAARPILDACYADEIARMKALYAERKAEGRASCDLETVARAATFGQVDTLLADIDAVIHGRVDEETGVVTLGPEGPDTYGVGDEIAARVLAHGGHVLAVRRDDLPEDGSLAAILRFPM